MRSSTHSPRNEQASAEADASASDVISAWEKVLQSIKVKMRLNAELIAADFRLSLRAIIVTLVCILLLVGLSLTIWITTLVALCIGLTQWGMHWGLCVVIVLVLHGVAIWVVKQTMKSSMQAIEMKTSCEAILPKDTTSRSKQDV